MSGTPENEPSSGISFGSSFNSRNGPRGEFVYKALLQGIRSGQIMPGDRIREEDVAQALGVSRTP